MDKKRARRRKKRRARRKNVVFVQKIGIVAAILGVVAGGVYAYNQLPSVKVNKFLNIAQEYEEAEDYTNALASYEEALKIEAGTVKAYHYMANLYLDLEDYRAAEEILYRGLSQTQDAQIHESYLTVKYNESVNEINGENCTFQTVERLLDILEEDKEKTSVYELLGTCRQRLSKEADEDGINRIMLSEGEGLGFMAYQSILERMLALYEEDGKAEMKRQLVDFVALPSATMAFSREDFTLYYALVERVEEATGSEELVSLMDCLNKYQEIDSLFSPLLGEFEAGNYEAARDFLVSDEYVAIRDSFIEGTMEYWRGETYIPFSHIGVYLHHAEGNWEFSFMDEEKVAAKQGYIKVWGFKWLDNGHQRTAITYVPVSEGEEYYPMTEYCIMYWWSTPVNMELTEATYARMNFRFEENIYTQEGKTTRAINDWGGKYEYKDTYE